MTELIEDEDLFDDDFSVIITFPAAWTRIPVHQLSLLLRLGISIFALFVIYLGGRSKTRRFNDRIIEAVNNLINDIPRTALVLRAVFIFLFPGRSPPQRNDNLFQVIVPIMNPCPRRY